MDVMCAIINTLWSGACSSDYQRYRRALNHPGAEQRRLLMHYVRENAETEYGRRFGFTSLRSVSEYQDRVPLTTFDDYQPYVERIQAGDRQVLTRAPVRRLVPSSGSTRAQKLTPFTGGLQSEFSRAVRAWILDLYCHYPTLAGGPAYWSISPVLPVETLGPSAVPIGFDEDTAYLGGFWKPLIDATMAVPSALRFIQDMDAFRYATLLFLVRANELRLISVWHPSFLTLLLDDLPRHWASILHDLAAGTITTPVRLPDRGKIALRPWLRPARQRAAELMRISPDDYQRIWPKLKLITCWADAHAALGVAGLRRRFEAVTVQPKGLIATEAFVTLPFADQKPVAIRSHFFEFLADDGSVHLVDELDVGGEFSVVVTTGGGLYRYRLHDRIRVDSYLERTPSLTFLGKEDHVCDRFGEKLSAGFVGAVLQRLFGQCKIRPSFAMLAPEMNAGRWGYMLFVETNEALPSGLADGLEAMLRENPHYRYCVRLGQLLPVRVCETLPGAFSRYVAELRRRGQRTGNIKPSPLDTSPGWVSILGDRRGPRPGHGAGLRAR
ncbi:MAG: GH3 auxin-responsive promoter family protein [Phycisphaerales bacterium]|nr:MAG: GH3 auxin-responsive promoter family protein [Phycisphaerales bacterium]